MERTVTQSNHQSTFFYKLIIAPGITYRIGRHLLILLGVVAISYNQAYMGFLGYHPILGSNMFFITLFYIVTYLILGYFNVYVLVPRLLLKEKYLLYFIVFVFSMSFFIALHFALEYYVYRYYHLEPSLYSFFSDEGSPFYLELASSFLVDSIAILGVSFTVILKRWLINGSQVLELETTHIHSEVERLKEQVNPDFLFSILHKVGDTVERNQARASDMLMELSEVLRYELYDSNRQEVLLNSEIIFIRNYLDLEKSYYEKMDFEVLVEGNTNGVLVPPLLFLPIVQYTIKKQQEENRSFCATIQFLIRDEFVSLFCSCTEVNLEDPGLKNIRLRLEKLYGERYTLQAVNRKEPALYLNINFQEHERIG